MEVWFSVRKKDVIALLEMRKDCFPWGDHPEEKYRCLVFREDGMICMTVDEFYEADGQSYECCRYYTTVAAETEDEFRVLTKEKLASMAYSAWCSGAR